MKDISIFITTSGFIFIVVAFLFLGNNNAALIKLIAWIRECAKRVYAVKKNETKEKQVSQTEKEIKDEQIPGRASTST